MRALGGNEDYNIERRLQALCLRRVEILQLIDCCLELSNGRCPWDVYVRIPFAVRGTLKVSYLKALGLYVHIGVGSNVVCSTAMGNARASTRGIDNSDSTLFCVSIFVRDKKAY
jgi:hypothetical protein